MKTTRKPNKAAGLVTNSAPPPVTEAVTGFQHITANLKTKLVRNEKLGGKDYIVAPMVMIVEGVHNGSKGPLFYPKTELAKTPATWNHKPIVIQHPTDNEGAPRSACDKDMLEKYGVGIIMNTVCDKAGRLTAEAWIDADKCDKVDGGTAVLNALKKGTPMEVSTGLFTDDYNTPGTFEGDAYEYVARNYRADHLAILPDKEGACSMAKGAGLIRNEAAKKGRTLSDAVANAAMQAGLDLVTANALSFDEIRARLCVLLDAKFPRPVSTPGEAAKPYSYPYLCDVYEGYFVYSHEQTLFKQAYTSDAKTEAVTLSGEPVKVVRVVEYRTTDSEAPVGNSKQTQNTKVHPTMKPKAEVIAALIANHGWSESDRTELEALSEATVNKLLDKAVTKAPAPAANAAPATVESFLQAAPAEVAAVINNALAVAKAEKDGLITEITGNAKNTFTKEQLEAMPVANLKAIAAFAKSEAKAPAPAANYAGQGGAEGKGKTAPVANAGEEAPLGLPSTAPVTK